MFSIYYQLNFFANFYFSKVIQVDWLLVGQFYVYYSYINMLYYQLTFVLIGILWRLYR